MKLIMSGGITQKKGGLLQGKVKDIATRLVDVLAREKVV
jgi:hypothetical protein